MYAAMYKKMCATPKKINVYNDPVFIPLPVVNAPPALTQPLYQPLTTCGVPYQTPMYHPPYCGCLNCKK